MRKVSLALVALALVALLGAAAKSPARAFQLNGCTTIFVESFALTAKIVDPGNLQNQTVFTEGCQIGIALTHGGQTIKNVTVIGQGPTSVTLADILETGSSSNAITNVNLTSSQVGMFSDYSSTVLNHATITGTQIGLFADAGYQGTVTLKNSNIFDNVMGVDLYRTHLSSSWNNIHENYIGGLFNWGGFGGSSHDTFYGNQGVGVDSEDSAGGLSLRNDNVDNNGYGAPCTFSTTDVVCSNNTVSVYILGFYENFVISDLDQTSNGFYAGIETYDSKMDLNHTNVRYNAVGIAAFEFSFITLTNHSIVCNNHNFIAGNANVITDGTATVTANGGSQICF